MKQLVERDKVLEDECRRLALEHKKLLDFVYMTAASKNSKGVYSNSRDTLREKAGKVLETMGL